MKHPDAAIFAAMNRTFRVVAAFNNLEPEEQRIFAERLALIFSAGSPIAAFEADRLQCEAESWVRLACADELEAYALAIEDELMRRAMSGRNDLKHVLTRLWARLSSRDRADFINHVTSGRAA